MSSGRRLNLPNRMMPTVTPMTEMAPRLIVAMIDALAPHAGGLEDGRLVVDDRVDAGELLGDGQSDADPQQPAHSGERPQVAQCGALVLRDVLLGVLGDPRPPTTRSSKETWWPGRRRAQDPARCPRRSADRDGAR
jgi:hypothetical protein